MKRKFKGTALVRNINVDASLLNKSINFLKNCFIFLINMISLPGKQSGNQGSCLFNFSFKKRSLQYFPTETSCFTKKHVRTGQKTVLVKPFYEVFRYVQMFFFMFCLLHTVAVEY